MHEANDVKEISVKIYVDEKMKKEEKFYETGTYEISVPVNVESEWIRITMESNSQVKPKGDERFLSYLINSVYLN